MNWTSFSEFIHMNGHGYYVWWAYGALLVGVVYELVSLAGRRRKICNRVIREARASRSAMEM